MSSSAEEYDGSSDDGAPLPTEPGEPVDEATPEYDDTQVGASSIPSARAPRKSQPGGESQGKRSWGSSEPPNRADLPPPTSQFVSDALLLGFDPSTSIATFAVRQNGVRREIEVWVPRSDPLYNAHYRMLLSALDRNGRVPALKIRVGMPADEAQLPILLLAAPVEKEGENEFTWVGGNGVKLRWTEEIDEAVDIDFDRYCDLHAASYLTSMLSAPNQEQAYAPAREVARTIFCQEAPKLGIQGNAAEVFDRYAATNFAQVVSGAEVIGGKPVQVRYDTRYTFRQQAKHMAGITDEASIASALANYASQQGLSVHAANVAMGGVDLGNGKAGSLAEKHQIDLVADRGLLAVNPSFAEYKDIFAEYSHENVRSAVNANLAGMMDAAGVPAALPSIDHIDHDKQNSESKHMLVLDALPDAAKQSTDAGVRAGAYLKTSQEMEARMRNVSFQTVANAQQKAGPREIKDTPQRPNTAADLIRSVVKAVDKIPSLMDGP